MTREQEVVIKRKSLEALMWLGIVSIIMLFAGLTSAYVVRKGEGNWMLFDLPQIFYISTAIILLSSITMNWALSAIKKDDKDTLKKAIGITLLLGAGFFISQFAAYNYLVGQGIYFAGKNAAGSYLYMLSGVHLAHVIGGILGLVFVLVKSLLKKYSYDNYHGIYLLSIYWHFLGILWVFLFLFLIFFR